MGTWLSDQGLEDELSARSGYLVELMRERDALAAAAADVYRLDPAGWVRDCITWPAGQELAPYQAEIMGTLVRHGRIAVRGCHGLGKSTIMALLTLWFALTREAMGRDWKVITTASVWRQLHVYLWPEIHKWSGRVRWDRVGRKPLRYNVELLGMGLKLGHGSATAVASNISERIEGAHADSLLYILDEAKIIPPRTWDAIEGALANAGGDTDSEAFIAAMSTPGEPSGRFYDIHRRAPGLEDWKTRHVTLEESIAAGRISRDWADQRRVQWGEDSALYQGRVLGQFHAGDESSVIPLAWVEAAIERWHRTKKVTAEPDWVGVDVGRGGDDSILAVRCGPRITLTLPPRAHRDTMAIVTAIQATGARPIIDVIGVGAGVYDRCRELDLRPVAYVGSGKARGRDRSRQFGFVNVRSEAYWRLRELLDPETEPTLALPPDDLLISDLTTPTWDITSGIPPKIKVENKDAVVARLGRSPDRGDAVAAAMFADALRSPTIYAEPSGSLPSTGLSPLG